MGDRFRDVPYPAWWIARASELLPLVAGARAALVFGSYATGLVGRASDLDVMIVLDEDGPPWNERCARGKRELDLGVPCDLVAYTPDEFDHLEATQNFVAQAAREGLWFDAATTA